jgi:hypothetical protein
MAAKSQDKILFGAALLLLLASAGWMALQSANSSGSNGVPEVNITPSEYIPSGIDAPTVATKTWPPAPAQSSGPLWVYDVFTPPEIYYDSTTKQFTVTPPNHLPPPPPPPPPPFGVELVQIRQDAFRLQLVGYIGDKGDYRGTFENALSGETVIGRAGKKFPDLGLTIKSFEVKRNTTISEESMPIIETEAVAIVVDDKTGEEIPLTNKRRRIKGEPFAVLKAENSGETFEHKAGATFKLGEATYTVISIKDEPPSVEIRKEAPDLKEPLTKTLTSAAPVAPVPAPSDAPAQPAPAPSTPFPFGN